MKIRSVGGELLPCGGETDGWTDRHDEFDRRFSSFCDRT